MAKVELRDMKKHKPLIDEDGEVHELLMEDIRRFRPASEVLSPTLLEKLAGRRRGPQKAPTKKRIKDADQK